MLSVVFLFDKDFLIFIFLFGFFFAGRMDGQLDADKDLWEDYCGVVVESGCGFDEEAFLCCTFFRKSVITDDCYL